jgi:hypothetical protein
VHSRKQGRQSINPTPARLTETHFIEKILPTGKMAKPQKKKKKKKKITLVSL